MIGDASWVQTSLLDLELWPEMPFHWQYQATILDLAMKIELRKHLQSQDIPNFKTEVKKDILENGMLHFIGQYCQGRT